MTSTLIRRLVIENVPLTDHGAISVADLRRSVEGDCYPLGVPFAAEQFDLVLQALHQEQLIFVFRSGQVKMTGMGKFRFG